jgi:hypothetical protein
VQNAFTIRSAWTAGDHLAATDPRRRVWLTLDPVGSLGIQLRDGIGAAAKCIGGKLDAARNLVETRQRADLRDDAMANVLPEHRLADGRLFATSRSRASTRCPSKSCASSLVPYVTIEVVENTIKVREIGLVNVYTIDNVQVSLNVAADRGVETAGLRHALDRIGP